MVKGKNMKYKKFITRTLVTVLLCTSISVAVGAKNPIFSKDDFQIKNRFGEFFKTRGFRSIFSNFFQMIRNLFSMFFNRHDDKEDEEDDSQEDPKLEFILDLKEKYYLGDPINIAVILANIGEQAISLLEMDFKSGTIDYFIDTPDGYNIHWIGHVKEDIQHVLTIKPQQS